MVLPAPRRRQRNPRRRRLHQGPQSPGAARRVGRLDDHIRPMFLHTAHARVPSDRRRLGRQGAVDHFGRWFVVHGVHDGVAGNTPNWSPTNHQRVVVGSQSIHGLP